jgi:CheY-like chemotaxis protein
MDIPLNSDQGIADFRRAKVEHFLSQARDFLATGRLLAARGRLEKVFELDRSEEEGRALKRELEGELALVTGSNGEALPDGSPESAEGGAPRGRRKELVLIVDQDEELLASLAASLRRYGYGVMGAASYDEAVETMKLVPPHVVVSEINFDSGPRGFDLFLWTKTNASAASPLFFFLATRIDREAVIAGKRFGVEDLIPKPVDVEVVLASIASSLSRRNTLKRGA